MRNIISLLLLLCSAIGFANPTDSIPQPRFSFLTVGPGPVVYMLEGHSALRVQYPDGRDIALNWGTFDFNDPGFAMKFARGETDYWVSAQPTQYFLYEHRALGRYILEQPLNLSASHINRLQELVEENLLPENRVYRYRYLSDNCATRPAALINQAIADCGDSLTFNTPATNTTWRKEFRNYHANNPFYQLFIDLALGADIDRQITPQEQAFAPIFMHKLISQATIVSPDETAVPLTLGSNRLSDQREDALSGEPSPAIVVIPLCFFTALVVGIELRRRKLIKWFNALVFFLLGVIGAVVTFLVFLSTQEATGNNINLLWLNPLLFAPVLLIWSKKTRRILNPVMWIIFLLTLTYLIGIPLFNQSTGIWLPLIALCDLSLTASYLILCCPLLQKTKNQPNKSYKCIVLKSS